MSSASPAASPFRPLRSRRDCSLGGSASAEGETQGLIQEALAEAAGLHRIYVSLLEGARRTPSLEVICVAKGLRTTMASLVWELE